MSRLYRYTFSKQFFKETIILFLEKEEYRSFKEDYKILEMIRFKKISDLKRKKINYVVLQGLTIIDQESFVDNTYKIYYTKVMLLNLIEREKDKIIGQLFHKTE